MDKVLAARTARKIRSTGCSGLAATVGLDAFVDEIVRVVDKRASSESFTLISQLHDLGARIAGASGRSTNLELVVERVKLGGNGPIMANALAAFGVEVTCVGPFGEPDIHPAFAEIASRARVVSIGQPAHTDALEFEDGKLMLGKLETLDDVTWHRLRERMGDVELRRRLVESDLVALVNWTMIPAMSEIWQEILCLLRLSESGPGLYFFDLADPEKHSIEAVASAVKLLSEFATFRTTLLGMNEKEAFLVGESLGYRGRQVTRQDLIDVSLYISAAFPRLVVVVHPRSYALTARAGALTALVDGPFTSHPRISTGAGDHFNAGFCLAMLMGLHDDEALAGAVATSGFYVREAASPSLTDVAELLERESHEG